MLHIPDNGPAGLAIVLGACIVISTLLTMDRKAVVPIIIGLLFVLAGILDGGLDALQWKPDAF